jgi:hypothetical protein
VTEKVNLVATLYIISSVLSSNLKQDAYYTGWGFSWYRQCLQENAAVGPTTDCNHSFQSIFTTHPTSRRCVWNTESVAIWRHKGRFWSSFSHCFILVYRCMLMSAIPVTRQQVITVRVWRLHLWPWTWQVTRNEVTFALISASVSVSFNRFCFNCNVHVIKTLS